MKRLGLYALILITLFSVETTFSSPEKAFAQTAVDTSKGTYDQYQNTVNGFFNTTSQAIDSVATRDTSATTVQFVKNYKKYLEIVSGAYTTTFNTEKAKGTPPVNAQLAAILAFNRAQQVGSTAELISSDNGNSPLRRAISELSKNMAYAGQTAGRINSNNLDATSQEAAITTGSASTITNAVAGNKNPVGTAPVTNPSSCSLLTGNLIGCVDALFAWIIRNTLINLAGVLLWIASNMVNLAVQLGILNFSSWADSSLYTIWIIVRQIVSLFVVFAGLYLGFMYIIGQEDTFGKYIGWLTLFALFVNFSYPLTRSVIDISNVISLNIYASTVGTAPLTTNDVIGSNGAGSLIMERLGITNLVGQALTEDKGIIGNANTTPGAVLTLVYVVYAAYILFLVTGILLFRTAVLVFLTIASPILFVDSVVPLLGDEAKKLRKMFLEQLFVAPVFMIMFALTMKFLEVFQSGPLKTGTTGAGTQAYFNIFLMLIMLNIMLKVTKSVGGSMSAMAISGMGKIGGVGLGLTAGVAGLAARRTLGGLAAKASESGWIKNNQDSFIGRRAYDLSSRVATSSFDLRNSKTVTSGMNKAGMGMGAGNKTGYNQDVERKVTDRSARYARIDQTYKEDVLDKDGNMLHAKGDVNEAGKIASNRFAQSGGGSIFNKKEVTKGIKEVQDKQNTEEEAAANKLATEKTQDYAKADKKRQGAVLQNLQQQLDAAAKNDPNKEGTEARGLSMAIKNIQESKDKEYDTLQKEVTKSLEKIKLLDEKKAAIFKADLSDQVRVGVEAGGMAPRATSGSSMIGRNRPAPVQQVSFSNQTVTTDGNMPASQSSNTYTQATSANKDTTITSQTSAPMSDQELAQRETPAYLRKAEAGNNTQSYTEQKPGFLQTAEDKISARATSGGVNTHNESFRKRASNDPRYKRGDSGPESSSATVSSTPKSPSPTVGATV